MGINCARQLSSYGVHTVVVLSEPGLYTPQLANEMALYQFTTGTLITSAAGNFQLKIYYNSFIVFYTIFNNFVFYNITDNNIGIFKLILKT